jgi:predicted negative regulator of RcsB-dependent stress response
MRRLTVTAATAALVCLAQPALAAKNGKQQLGSVHFETSCTPTAQRLFDQGMLYQHSFWYKASQRTFEDVLKSDPKCAIAYWGIGLSLLYNPHAPPPPENLPLGLDAVQKAKALGAATERERDYIDAIAAMYVDYDKVDHRTRVQRYLKATEQVAQKYPKDDEAQIAYAITLNVAASPADKTYANQLKGAALLEPIFKRAPQHPGVAHYLIHLYDYPAIAEKGLPAAKRYATIAAAAPHAQHMPSHIFTRVGYWKESIKSNAESARVAKLDGETHDQAHGMDYMVYAHLQLAQDKKARAVIDEMNKIDFKLERFVGTYAVAASTARYVFERGDWKAAAELQPKSTKFLYADAVTHFARAMGAARSGNPAAAKADVAKLGELSEGLKQAKDAYWSEIVRIQQQVASAWVLYAEGKHDEALNTMSAAADAEDKTDKHPVTPGPLAPARELYGAMLLDRGQAKEALAAYEAVLKKEPNRLAATIGAANAAAKAGEADKAKQYTAKVFVLTKEADTQRPEVAELRGRKTAATR